MTRLTYRAAVLVYTLIILALSWHYWIQGQVVAPYRQFEQLAVLDTTGATLPENHKFGDFANQYVPEVAEHMHAPRSGWLTLWINENQLGRPAYHISGLSPAYPPSWLLMHVIDDPRRFITALSLAYVFLSGVFLILFCREWRLAPLAALIAATTLAASPLFMYWLTFPMFLAVWCWTTGALWSVTRLYKRPDLLGWGVLAFSGYSLLMTAYPQLVVFNAYILTGYGVFLVSRRPRTTHSTLHFIGLALSALLVGAALTYPVYHDLAMLAAESARTAPDASFFTMTLPTLHDLTTTVRLVVASTVPELFGNPISSSYPLPYDGLSTTPIAIFGASIALLAAFRKTWGWWLCIGLLCLLTFVQPVYVFGIQHLGLNLSRSNPLSCILLPLSVLMAFGFDGLFTDSQSARVRLATVVAAIAVLTLVGIGVAYGIDLHLPLRWRVVVALIVVAALLVSQRILRHPAIPVTALLLTLCLCAYPLTLRQNPQQIASTSPLVEKMRSELAPGSRYAMVAPGVKLLPPNLNAEVNLPSVHSYNSLSPRRYHKLIEELGGHMETYGRFNGSIAPDYDSVAFWMSNIGLVLTPQRMTQPNLNFVGSQSGLNFYKVTSRMGSSLQVIPQQLEPNASQLTIADPRLLASFVPKELANSGDAIDFAVHRGPASVLMVSQVYHSDWKATVLTSAGWTAANTAPINGVFQGVVLPPGTDQVRLAFKPVADYAWIAHIFWAALLGIISFGLLRLR